MRVDPSEPPCRGRLQTAVSCYGPMAAVVNVMVKRRGHLITSCGDERDECKRTADDASKPEMTSKPGGCSVPGKAWQTPTYWPCGVRCIGSVNLIWAFVRNLRTWLAMAREKVQAEKPRGRKYRCGSQGRTAP